MDVFGVQILVVVVFAASVHQFPVVADSEPDFKTALKLVNEAKNKPGNINYYTGFCKKTGQGASKLGCQISAMDDVGLLVCLEPGVEPDVCKVRLQYELNGLKIIRDRKLKALVYYNEIIDK